MAVKINQIVQTIAKGWNRGRTVSNPQTRIAEEIIAGFNRGVKSTSSVGGNTLELTLKPAKKYLDDFCDVFTEGKYTVIKPKRDIVVDISKIGELNKDGTIIRYQTPKQAEEAARKILLSQFNVPPAQQRELCLITRKNDLFLNSIGDAHDTGLPSVIDDVNFSTMELKIFHNHPTNNPSQKSYPLSLGDIYLLASENVHSITAINNLGEFNTAILKEPLGSSWSISQYIFRTLKNRLEPIIGKNVVPGNNPELYIKEVHKAYKELLPQWDIEYLTNYSYLTN